MTVRTDRILARRNATDGGDLVADLGAGQDTALARLGALTQFDFEHPDLVVRGDVFEFIVIEPALAVAYPVLGRADLKYYVGTTFQVPRRQAAFAGVEPAAGFLRTVGRGPKLSRPLDEAEAERAMAMILAGDAEPAQIGALFLLLRFRAETPAELAGFVRAARASMSSAPDARADLD